MIIETEGLTKRFGKDAGIRDLTMNVPRGSAMAMIGANGAGKTTTLRTLLNIYPPDSGTARVLGTDSRAISHRDFQKIGFVSENQKLPAGLTVGQFFNYLRTLYDSWDQDMERKLRSDFDLPPNRRIGALSHGMRMKCALAAALPFRPDLLVLDEPLSGLDPLFRDEVMEGILDRADETTILISSHELAEIEGFATDVVFIEDGKLKFQESMENLRLRFRSVIATFAAPVDRPKKPSTRWLNVKTEGRALSFIDSGFVDEASLARRIGECAGPPERLELAPLSLRDISKSLMRARKEAVQ